jgi:hypothetical protein
LERHFDPQELVDRILFQLEQSEKRESDPWLRDDIRQAWISVSTFSRGPFPSFQDAFVAASYRIYGTHPDQVWPKIVARRHAMLGAEYADFFPNASGPKKPCASVGRRRDEGVA